MRSLALLAIVALYSCVSFAVEGKTVSYKSGDETVQAVLYAPATQGKLPALVILHNWMGLTDWAKQQAAKWADEGYVTLAVDMYRGTVAKNGEEASKLMSGVPQDRADRDLLAATEYLRSLPNVDPDRVGALGWSMGGGNTLRLAYLDSRLKVAVINYGGVWTDEKQLPAMKAHVLGLFGAKDGIIPLDKIAGFEKNLKSAGKTIQVKIYPEADHAFDNDGSGAYRKADAENAWKVTKEFLQRNL